MENINQNDAQSKSQCAMILEHLQEGYSLTSLEALNKFGCLRLASRISDLHEKGYNIQKKMVVTPSGKRVADYYIPR